MSSQHKDDAAELPTRLRALRGERSQAEFARIVGLTRSALANYENGRTAPKPSILRQISERAGVSDSFLLSGEVRNEYELNLVVTGRGFINECHETPDELTIVRALRAVSPQTVETVLGLLIRDIGDSAETRARLGNTLGSDLERLDQMHRSGGHIAKGHTREQHADAAREIKRLASGRKA